MRKKLVIFNIVLSLVALLAMFGLGLLVTDGNNTEITERHIKTLCAVYVDSYHDGIDLSGTPDDIRVTVIDGDGRVVADSETDDVSGMGNHADREEIVAAANGLPRVVVRDSASFGREMMYYAQKTETSDGQTVFIRVAVPTESLSGYIYKSVFQTLMILLVVWFASTVASVVISGALLKPLKSVKNGLSAVRSGTYERTEIKSGDADVDEILDGIGELSAELQNGMETAVREKQRLNDILDNVSDGIAVFDSNLNAVAVNKSMTAVFGSEIIGKDVNAFRRDDFISAVKSCAEDRRDALFTFDSEGLWYSCKVNYIDSDTVIASVCDITRQHNSEKMRLEFFANASHELKTPLTAIKGFNDMISLSRTSGKVAEYSQRISKETDRMLNLLNDMLDIGKLENAKGIDEENVSDVDLADVAHEVTESLKTLSESREVAVSVSGGGTVRAEREHMYELVKNLVENGIRYNNPGGKVDVSVAADNGALVLTVADDGIGIDAANQTRIFERFYRVDKSRSRSTGGTGLGLSIVKHICELYGAEISLYSKPGEGTTISVVFRKAA